MFTQRNNQQKGFTLIEMAVVLVVVGLLVTLALRTISGGNASMRVGEAVDQVKMLQSAINAATPRSGIYSALGTTVTVQTLIDDGYLPVPRAEDGTFVAPTEMNPWGGAVVISSPVSTQYEIEFTGITSANEAEQFARRLNQMGDVANDATTVTLTIGADNV